MTKACPSCGVNMADLPRDHVLTTGRAYENAPLEPPRCNYAAFKVPEAGWYDTGDGVPRKLTDDEVRARSGVWSIPVV